MSEWQPIETAPKDGSDFLCYVPRTHLYGDVWHDEVMCVGYWSDFRGGEVRVTHCAGGETPLMERQPTHWMLLPEPPKDA